MLLVGAVAFGGALIGLARVLPSDDAARYVPGADPAPAEVLAPAAPPSSPSPPGGEGRGEVTATPDVGPPPASGPLDMPPQPVRALDFRPVDVTMRDRYGNPPKRDVPVDELLRMAAGYDIVVDDLRWQPDGAALNGSQIAAMKAANPRLRVLRYLGALTNNDGPIFNIAPDDGVHGAWFLRDGSGDFVRAYEEVAAWDAKPSYAFDPASIDVRNMAGAWARQFAKLGYDGVLLGGVSACAPAADTVCASRVLLSHPLNKATNRPYTDADWLAATAGLLQAIRHAAPTALIFLEGDTGGEAPLLGYADGSVLLSLAAAARAPGYAPCLPSECRRLAGRAKLAGESAR